MNGGGREQVDVQIVADCGGAGGGAAGGGISHIPPVSQNSQFSTTLNI